MSAVFTLSLPAVALSLESLLSLYRDVLRFGDPATAETLNTLLRARLEHDRAAAARRDWLAPPPP